jgi:hypothetical protein
MRHFPTLPFAFYVAAHLLRLTLASSSHPSQSFLGNLDAQVANNTPFHPSFDAFVDDLMKDWHIPGLAIAVVHENQTWSKVILLLALDHISIVASLSSFYFLCLSKPSTYDHIPGLNFLDPLS